MSARACALRASKQSKPIRIETYVKVITACQTAKLLLKLNVSKSFCFEIKLVISLAHHQKNKTESKFSPRSRAKKLFKFFQVFVNLIQFLTGSKITICNLFLSMSKNVSCAKSILFLTVGK